MSTFVYLGALLAILVTAVALWFTNRQSDKYMPDHPCVRRKRETRRHHPNFNPWSH